MTTSAARARGASWSPPGAHLTGQHGPTRSSVDASAFSSHLKVSEGGQPAEKVVPRASTILSAGTAVRGSRHRPPACDPASERLDDLVGGDGCIEVSYDARGRLV
jgi:hypothetical protein